jgi:hypothetical protein
MPIVERNKTSFIARIEKAFAIDPIDQCEIALGNDVPASQSTCPAKQARRRAHEPAAQLRSLWSA